MNIIRVAASSPYEIIIEPGLLSRSGDFVRRVSSAKRNLIVTDSQVEPLYLKTVQTSLLAAGFEVSSYTFTAGEQSKTLDTVGGVLNAAADAGLDRHDLLVALGGGVTGDLCGFAAAVYLRGVDFVQMPTTLLAAVDSSVGGKTGCDLPSGKNLAGAFHQPRLVLCDPDCLRTLPPVTLADGAAELIKAAAIKDLSLFEKLEQGGSGQLPQFIQSSVQIKRAVVESDEREMGERRLLNFGHTLGHAIERLQHFRGLTHGQAVAVGMVLITAASERAGLTNSGTAARLSNLLRRYGLPDTIDLAATALAAAAQSDKKRTGSRLALVLLRDIGDAFVHEIPSADLAAFLS